MGAHLTSADPKLRFPLVKASQDIRKGGYRPGFGRLSEAAHALPISLDAALRSRFRINRDRYVALRPRSFAAAR